MPAREAGIILKVDEFLAASTGLAACDEEPMGAWGTGIFQDDTACDIRDDYRGHLGDGLSGPESTARILKEYASSLADPGESGVVWLALAAAQWRCGRLEPETLEKALGVIDSGSDLARWQHNAKDLARRRVALEKLRAQLTSAQPPQKKVRKQLRATCDWPVGAVIAYRLHSGNLAILRVIGYHTDKGGTSPVCELLDWSGQEPPSQETLRSARVREGEAFRQKIHRLMLLRLNKDAARRIVILDFTLEPFHQPIAPQSVVLWTELDVFLKRWFRLE